MDLKALLIDVDGTAVNCEPRNRSVIEDIAMAAGFEIQPHHWERFAGTSHDYIWQHLSGEIADFPEGRPSFKDTFPNASEFELACEAGYKKRMEEIEVNPKVLKIVRDFLSQSKPVIAVSNTNTAAITRALKHTKYPVSEFVALCGRDQVVEAGLKPKPAPDPYQHALEKINLSLETAGAARITPQDCLVLEDSKTGVRSALQFGGNVIQITDYASPLPDSEIFDLTSVFNARFAHGPESDLLDNFDGMKTIVGYKKDSDGPATLSL